MPKFVLGLDEVGRGAWAGPMAIGAVLWPADHELLPPDSKSITARSRERWLTKIRDQALFIGIGWVSAQEIDSAGLGPALKIAAARSVQGIQLPDETQVVIDGTINLLPQAKHTIELIPRADANVPAVGAASIAAKVMRDRYMHLSASVHPRYGFDKHVGYGTAAHRQALQQYGAIQLHRRSFKPIADIVNT